jgi:hypothetical protein
MAILGEIPAFFWQTVEAELEGRKEGKKEEDMCYKFFEELSHICINRCSNMRN